MGFRLFLQRKWTTRNPTLPNSPQAISRNTARPCTCCESHRDVLVVIVGVEVQSVADGVEDRPKQVQDVSLAMPHAARRAQEDTTHGRTRDTGHKTASFQDRRINTWCQMLRDTGDYSLRTSAAEGAAADQI